MRNILVEVSQKSGTHEAAVLHAVTTGFRFDAGSDLDCPGYQNGAQQGAAIKDP